MKRRGGEWRTLASYTILFVLAGCSDPSRKTDLGGLPAQASAPLPVDCPRTEAPDAEAPVDASADAAQIVSDAGADGSGAGGTAPTSSNCDAGTTNQTPALLRIEYGARDKNDPSTGFYRIEPRFFVPEDCTERPLASTETFSCTMYECRQPFSMPRNPPSPPKPLLGDLQIRGRVLETLFPIPSMSAYKAAEREDATLPTEIGSLQTTPLLLTSSVLPSTPFELPLPIAIEFTTTKAELGLVQRTSPPSIAWQRPLTETDIEYSIETDRRRIRCVFPSRVSPQVLPASVFRELNQGAYSVSVGTRVRTVILRPGIHLAVEAVRIGNAAGVPLRRAEGTLN